MTFDPEWLPLARELRERKWTYARIAEAVGSDKRTVHYRLNGQRKPKGEPRACLQCGKSFVPFATLGQRWCSRACANVTRSPEARVWNSERRRGTRNPNYKHGKRADTTARLFSLKEKGEECCRNCGDTGKLDMHHVIPRSMWRDGLSALLNGIPLCRRCHVGWHRRSLTIYRDVFTPEEWAFLSGVDLLGQNVEAWLDDRYPPQREVA